MTQDTIIRALRMLVLFLLQILIFNNMHLAGYITPLVIGYMLLRFRSGTSRTELLLWGFAIGILSDIFSNTAGMASSACTLLALLQPRLLKLFSPADSDEGFCPTMRTLGIWGYTVYTFLSMLVLHTVFYFLDAFTLNNIELTIAAIFGSTALATLICWILELSVSKSNKHS